ncbi:amidohydrolase family protein [candidate division KSB3 bacterium]|uniref:Amidohydrolase family protein n=1 Tax=candidate division KSB3 bacterium TaxID=2044937 RepID=A0A9D5JUL0_9BACT|nr:amidohydrolase family protein [candidate division KSB3 bacterium]MBD3324202.1 amidohydrolase family protein [candidate division KSB3 bacterium]
MDMLVRGKYVITDPLKKAQGILTDGAVYLSDGTIREVDDYQTLKAKYPDAPFKGNGNQLLMPGLIDGHSHGWGLTATQRGVNNDFLENCFLDWAMMLNLDPELNSMMSAIRHLRSGCTTLHHNNWGEESNLAEISEKVIRGYEKIGIRWAFSLGVRSTNILAYNDTEFFTTLPADLQAFFRPLVFNDKRAIAKRYFELFEHLYSTYNGAERRVIFGPSWAMGSTDEFLQRVKARADELGKLQIHIHTLQTPLQKAYGLKTYGKSLLAHLDDIGLVDENLTLGHAVFVNEADIELLATNNASITHHPSCNLSVRNGICPVYYLHKAGVNVALGIDDKGINDDEDAIMELRLIHKLHRVSGFDLANTPALDAFDVLQMGTVNAARVSGFAGDVGAITPRMKADLILVDLEEIMEDPWMSPNLNIAEIFIHRAKGQHVNTAIVGGKVIMEDRQFSQVDVEALYDEVRNQAAKGISPEQQHVAEMLQKLRPYYHAWYQGWEKLEFEPFYVMNSRK